MRKLLKYLQPLGSVVWNIALVMVLYLLCRLVFTLENWSLFPGLDGGRAVYLFKSAFKFDLSAILYTSIIYIVMALLPLRCRGCRWYALTAKTLFVVPNFIGIVANLVDVAYFPFTGARTNATVFSEFSNEDNWVQIILPEIARHWYLFLIGLAFLVALIFLYRGFKTQEKGSVSYYLIHTSILLAVVYPLIGGLRGGFGVTVRPITLIDAQMYVKSPVETAIVLNTPFSIYRTTDQNQYIVPEYYESEDDMPQAFSAVHRPDSSAVFTPRNVCIIVLESFSATFSEFLTAGHGTPYEGYMPFLDSLSRESLCFRWSFANGRKSIEALPSICSGIPSLIEPYFLSPYSTNFVSGIAGELSRHKGYHTAFFHGAPRGSLGLAGFTNISGFDAQYDKETFNDNSCFDGTWAIWDEPFLDYFKKEIDGFSEPFVSAVFTASSHHPFVIPKEYEGKLKSGDIPMCACVSYTDMALRKFFSQARLSPWFNNTIFVISADHMGITNHDEYKTAYGQFEIPMIIYDPSGGLKGYRDGIAQQIDLMPTLLSYMGYDRPYIAFGCDLLSTADDDTWAINYTNGIFQFYMKEWCLQYDGRDCVGLYDYRNDRMQEHNVLEEHPEAVKALLPPLQAVMQQYISRIVGNRLVYDGN